MGLPTALLIEDDAALLRGLKDNFESHGFGVQLARNGQEGLVGALALPSPDLMVLDIMLPEVNGFEICRAVRSRGLEMPIIMLTARDREEDVIRGLELGADDYITKPFSIRELVARAKAFLRRYRPEGSATFYFGSFRLDLSARKLFKKESPVALTAKEFRLLEYFIQRRDRALSRGQILDAVWGDNLIVSDRSVDRCVTTLRAKIEPDPHHPTFIHTLRDVGYRFESGSGGEGPA
jgi:DNA-binding response OmpR family regulator